MADFFKPREAEADTDSDEDMPGLEEEDEVVPPTDGGGGEPAATDSTPATLSPDVPAALLICEKLIFNFRGPLNVGASSVSFMLAVVLILLLFAVQVMQSREIASLYFSKSKIHPNLQMMWYVLLVMSISVFGISSNSFIYFQF